MFCLASKLTTFPEARGKIVARTIDVMLHIIPKDLGTVDSSVLLEFGDPTKYR
jgi:hypothetical protein